MRVEREPFPASLSPASVVTIGKFDGVHLGHRAVLAETVRRARELGVEAAVVTFDRNPLALLHPEASPPAIASLEHRLELIAETGVDLVAVLGFDWTRANQPAVDFVDELLVARLGARLVLVGADFRFGSKGEGDARRLRELGAERGFEVDLLADVGGHGVDRISTSDIRRLITEGRVSEAAARLGSPPSVTGEVVHGNARGRELGFPTANLAEDSVGVVPAAGLDRDEVLRPAPARTRASVAERLAPTSVRVTSRVVRSTNLSPSSCSNSRIHRLTAGWVRPMSSPARLKLPWLATARNTLSWRSEIFMRVWYE